MSNLKEKVDDANEKYFALAKRKTAHEKYLEAQMSKIKKLSSDVNGL